MMAAVVLLAGVLRSAWSQDRVILQQPGGSRLPLSGLVEDFTGRKLTIQVRVGDPLRHYPRDEVVEVQTSYTKPHLQGNALLAAARPSEARAEFTRALKEEDRAWVRRAILAQMVRCALWNGETREAVGLFLSIAESDPETFHFDVAPLAWSDGPTEPAVRAAAQIWIIESRAESQLIGASHLLLDAEFRDQAETVLRRLARDPNPKVQRLAQMQLWRGRSAVLATEGELLRWETAIDELPMELRGGGYFVLGQTLKRQQQPERAAALLLWIPMVYDADRFLAARACFDAAELVESFGDHNSAIRLYAEVSTRFADTPQGAVARKKWEESIRATDSASSERR